MAQGASSIRTQTAEPSNNAITQLNESLFELHKPSGRPSMVVLFFHGFQHGNYENAHMSTWKTEDGSTTADENFPFYKRKKTEDRSSTWLQTWLVDEDQYPDAQILSVAYNASLMKGKQGGTFDLYITGENIISDLLDANIAQDPHCPVVLVGHSFGGLVVKELCVQAQKRGSMGSFKHKNFLENIKGAFFYSTPHHGISREIAECFVSKTNQPLLEYVKVLSSSAARLHEDFEKLRKQCAWQTAGVGEGFPTALSRFNTQVIVPEGSSRYGHTFAIVPEADHISICRPISKISRPFKSLSSFLRGVSSTSKRAVRPQNHQSLPKSTIGIDNVMKELKQKLETVTSLGLAGMGGIGKTTMAKALFNDMEHRYEYTCFVGDVKNIEHGVEGIVLRDMHHMGKRFAEKDGGLEFLEGKELLLVLDDVASEKHIGVLSTLIDVIGVHEDSRFVVTSRDRELLDQCLEAVHPMPFLSQGDARELLLAHAFRQEASPSFVEHIDIVVGKCGGLALTLEVIGKHLYKKPLTIWKEAITILDRADNARGFDEKLWSKLRISFDGLDVEEKQMFLDCATIFYGKSLCDAKLAWSSTTNGLQETLWQHLLDLSLVWEIPVEIRWKKIIREDDDVTCGMHEQLLSLGRKIASADAENGLRMWDAPRKAFLLLSATDCSENDVKDIVAVCVNGGFLNYDEELGFTPGATGDRTLPENSTAENSTKAVHMGIGCDQCEMYPIEGPRFESMLRSHYTSCVGCFEKGGHRKDEYRRLDGPPSLEGSTLCKMRKLRYLDMYGLAIDGVTLPSTLVSLWMTAVHFSNFPFSPSDHERMAVLKITDCPRLRTLPTDFGRLSSLQVLEINSAPNLKTLPDSLGSLPKLAELTVSECCSLEELPQTFGQLVSLERLSISDSDALSALPESFGYLPKLKYLEIRDCRRLQNLPDTFVELQGLETLELHGTYLQSIPTDFGRLSSLHELRILGTACLKTLPDSFGSLPKLAEISFYNCDRLKELPQTFGHMASLETLSIAECDALSALPESFGYLPKLKYLDITGCRRLQNLPDTFVELQGLKTMELSWTYLQRIPNLENLRSLEVLLVCQDDPISTSRVYPICSIGRLRMKLVRMRRKLVMKKVELFQTNICRVDIFLQPLFCVDSRVRGVQVIFYRQTSLRQVWPRLHDKCQYLKHLQGM